MKKNLKGCLENAPEGTSRVLVDMNQYEAIERSGMTSDQAHARSAQMAACWRFSDCHRAVLATGGSNLSGASYLTFSAFALNGAGGSFSLMLDNNPVGEGKNGYECTLPIWRDGWNHYRIELPFMRAVGEPIGMEHIESICFDCVAGGQANRPDTKLYIDNLFIWEGMAPPLYMTAPELKGAAVFSRTGNFTIIDRKRICNTPDGSVATPFERDGVIWLPMAPVAAGIAHACVVDNRACTLTFTYRRKKYAFLGGMNSVTVDGEVRQLPFSPLVVEGMLFFPADYVREFFRWRQIFTDPMGLVVLSNRKNIYDSKRDEGLIWQLISDTTFLRPDGERVLNDLHKNFPNPGRGRLLASFDELMQLRKLAKTDTQLGDYVSRLKTRYGRGTEAFLQDPVSADADISMLRTAANATLAFAMLYRVTGEKCYCERVFSECSAICCVSNWGSASDMSHIALMVTLGYDWCRHIWSEAEKALIERTLLRTVMRPMLETYEGRGRMWRAGGTEAAVSACTALALSLGLSEVYPQTALRLLNALLRNVEACFAAYAPDGGYAEGVSAWEESSRALTLFVAMLRRATGSDYGFASAPGFTATARFPFYVETVSGSWNYHDTAVGAVDTAMAFRMSTERGDPVPAWMRRQQLLSGQKEIHPFDILFYTPVDDTMTPYLPLDALYRKAGLAVMRSSWNSDATVLGLHGGRNHEVRGDLDAGAVLLEMGGVRFFEETGGEGSLPMLLRRRAFGQNTYVINPAEESAPDQNPDAIVPICEMRSSDDRAYAVLDMATTNDAILRAKRGAMLTDVRKVAVIQDEMTLSQPCEVVWSLWTRASVALNASGRVATLQKNGKTLACRLCGVASPARFDAENYGDWTRMTVRIGGKEKIRMALVCRLLAEGEKSTARVYDVVPMSKWSEG